MEAPVDVSSCCLANFLSARVTLAVMAFLMFLITQMIRANVYIASVAMAKENEILANGTGRITGVAEWTDNRFSLFLGAFYWSYWMTELPGGILAQKFGGKRIMGASVMTAALLNIILPVACKHSFLLALLIRALQGLSLGVTWPVMHWLSARWIPQSERSKFMTIYHGAAIGTSITYPLSGIIIANYGWEFVYYFIGIVSVIWCFAWWILVYDSPSDHPRLSDKESKYLAETVKFTTKSKQKTPWKQIAQSKAFWAVLIASQGLMWGTITLSMQTPVYFYQVHNLDIESTGLLSGIPEISKFFFSLVYSTVTDRIIERKMMTVTAARKMAVAVSEIVPAVILIILGFFGFSDKIVATVLLSGICLVGGASASGSLANIVDISPNHAGTLLGIIKTLTIIPGVFSPLIVTRLTSGDHSGSKASQWKNVFILISGIYLFCSFIFLVFGSGKIQKWNKEIENADGAKKIEETRFLEEEKTYK